MTDAVLTTRATPFDPPLAILDDPRPIRRITFADDARGWIVTSYDLARALLADPRFTSALEQRKSLVPRPQASSFRPGARVMPGFFIGMDPPEHTRFRRLLTGQFTVRRMKALEPRIERIVADHLDAMALAGPPVDLVTAFALPVPSLVICELLGVPYEDRDRFQRDSSTLLKLNASDEEAVAAMTSIWTYLGELVERKRTEPADDLLGGLVAGGELSSEELVGIALLLLIAGHETTANMLGLGTFALLRHPDQLAALRDGTADVANAVEELLRHLTVIAFGVTRTALEDVEMGGELIRTGEAVAAYLPAVNRDPTRFARADGLDLTADAHGHLAFGHGVHQCLGQQLARIEMRIAYPALLRRFPTLRLAVPAEEVPLRSDMAIYGVHRLPVEW